MPYLSLRKKVLRKFCIYSCFKINDSRSCERYFTNRSGKFRPQWDSNAPRGIWSASSVELSVRRWRVYVYVYRIGNGLSLIKAFLSIRSATRGLFTLKLFTQFNYQDFVFSLHHVDCCPLLLVCSIVHLPKFPVIK